MAAIVISAISGVLAKVGVGSVLANIIARLAVGAVISFAQAALTRRRLPGREELKRELSAPTELPRWRFVYGRTLATGTPLSWPVQRSVMWGCWLLNSRQSEMDAPKVFLDDREMTFTGDPFDFTSLTGGVADAAPFAGYVNFWIQRGDQTAPPQRFLNDAPYSVSDPEFYKATDAWEGRTVIWMRLDAGPNGDRQQRWPSTPPLVEVESTYCKVYDPREVSHDPDDDSTWEFSENQALVMLDLLLNNPVQSYRLNGIDIPTFEWAANVADEIVPLKSGSNEPRYRAAGTILFEESVEIEDILKPVAIAGASRFTRVRGKLGVVPSAIIPPSETVGDVFEELQVEWLRETKDLPTRVLASYVSPSRGYEDADLLPWDIPGAQAADGGVRKTQNLRLTMVQSATQAMRLRKIFGYDARRQRKITTILPPDKLDVIPGSVSTVAFPTDYATINGNYEIIETSAKVVDDNSEGVMLQASAELLIVDNTGLAWVPAIDEEDVVDENLSPEIAPVERPGTISVTVEEFDTGSVVIDRIRFEFDPSPTPSVTGYLWEFKIDSEDWQEGGVIASDIQDAQGDVFGYLNLVSPLSEYSIRVRSLSPAGQSDWREIAGVGMTFVLSGVGAIADIAFAEFTGTAPASGGYFGVQLYYADEGEDFANATKFGNAIATTAGAAFTVEIGDTEAVSEFVNGGFSSDTVWTKGVGWTIGSGVATHSTTTGDGFLEQAVTLVEGEDYRVTYTQTGSGGTGTFARIEGSTNADASATTDTGLITAILTVPASGDAAGIVAHEDFAGTIDDIYLVRATPDALPHGKRDYWLVPVTQTGGEGTPSGPFTLTIP